jgi:gp16 family phage-associated protein
MDQAGISLAEWTRAHGVSYDIARGVLAGRIKAKRGEAHRIAVALGLKQGRVIAARLYSPMPSKPKAALKLVTDK